MELIVRDLEKLADVKRAKVSARFFKTGEGEYSEGDIFLGIQNGDLRKVVKKHWNLIGLDVVGGLLESRIHEERLVGVLVLVEKYEKQGFSRMGKDGGGLKGSTRKEIFDFYLANNEGINNWDLVDLSAWKIVGRWLLSEKDRSVLDKLALSESLWEKRIAIVSTFAFIREGELDDALRISKVLLGDSEDLICKAVGWMLREVGKRDIEVLKDFLRENYDELSRTTLRYAIERFGKEERLGWLRGRCG